MFASAILAVVTALSSILAVVTDALPSCLAVTLPESILAAVTAYFAM